MKNSTQMTGPARSMFPMVSVEDMDAAVAFYGELLGGEENYRFPADGEASFIVLRLGTSEVGLAALGDPLHGQPLRPVTGHRIELCVYVHDVDATVDVMRANGVPVVLDPVQQTWGETVAYVTDPDGNMLMLTA